MDCRAFKHYLKPRHSVSKYVTLCWHTFWRDWSVPQDETPRREGTKAWPEPRTLDHQLPLLFLVHGEDRAKRHRPKYSTVNYVKSFPQKAVLASGRRKLSFLHPAFLLRREVKALNCSGSVCSLKPLLLVVVTSKWRKRGLSISALDRWPLHFIVMVSSRLQSERW